MAVSVSSSRPVSSSRLRATCCGWPLTVLLVLSHSVWNTLQCATTSSNPRSQPAISIINVPREDYDGTDGRDDNQSYDQFPSSDSIEQINPHTQSPPGGYFARISRGSAGDGQETLRACAHRLTFELRRLCNGKFYDPSNDYPTRGLSMKRSVMARRVPRKVANECCRNSCSEKMLIKKYCADRNSTQPLPSTKNPVDDMNPSDSILQEEADPVPSTEVEQDPAFPHMFIHFLNYFLRIKQKTHPDENRSLPLPQPRVQMPMPVPSRPRESIFVAIPRQSVDNNERYGKGGSRARGHGQGLPGNPAFASPSRSSQRGQGGHFHHSTERSESGRTRSSSVGTGLNAATSTLPPQIFRVGPGMTNDYIQPVSSY